MCDIITCMTHKVLLGVGIAGGRGHNGEGAGGGTVDALTLEHFFLHNIHVETDDTCTCVRAKLTSVRRIRSTVRSAAR